MKQHYFEKLKHIFRGVQFHSHIAKFSVFLNDSQSVYLRIFLSRGADFSIFSFSFYISYLLHQNFNFYLLPQEISLKILLWSILSTGMFFALGLNKIIWRYVGIGDVFKLGFFSGLLFSLLAFGRLFSSGHPLFSNPWAVCINSVVFSFSGLVGVRILHRYLSELSQKEKAGDSEKIPSKRRTLLVGAGRLGSKFVSETQSLGGLSDLNIIGFIDDNPGKSGRSLSGVRVLSSVGNLGRVITENCIAQVIITIGVPDGELIKQVYKICEEHSITVKVTPSYQNLLSGKLIINQVKNVEIEDLLGRKPKKLNDLNVFSFLKDKTVCVTGAGGSIGSELVRQISKYMPQKILLIERAEPALYQIHREMLKSSNVDLVPLAVDVGDKDYLNKIFLKYAPQVVFHAAAHKHVPLMEENEYAAYKNNVEGTRILAEVAGKFEAEQFVLISTDKAVRPTSIMGKSKQMAEHVIAECNVKFKSKYSAVRFGNVLGSSGSVIPLFKEQIADGGPVTVTDEKMTRYFMTIPEACQLVLQAGSMGEGGDLFVLDMGEPIKILDLARDMIRLSGFIPEQDIKIKITGIRPGEKLYEELHHDYNKLLRTKYPSIFYTKLSPENFHLDRNTKHSVVNEAVVA